MIKEFAENVIETIATVVLSICSIIIGGLLFVFMVGIAIIDAIVGGFNDEK